MHILWRPSSDWRIASDESCLPNPALLHISTYNQEALLGTKLIPASLSCRPAGPELLCQDPCHGPCMTTLIYNIGIQSCSTNTIQCSTQTLGQRIHIKGQGEAALALYWNTIIVQQTCLANWIHYMWIPQYIVIQIQVNTIYVIQTIANQFVFVLYECLRWYKYKFSLASLQANTSKNLYRYKLLQVNPSLTCNLASKYK